MLTTENTCLVVVDIQEKLAKLVHDKDRVVSNSVILVKIAQALEIPILWCQQVPDVLGPTVHDLWGLFLKAEMESMDKTTFSCCGNPAFMQKIDEIKPQTAIVCGIESHVCVFQTVMDLIQHGLYVHVVADAVSSRTNENKQIGLHRMAKEGAVITSTEMLLFELLRDSKHPNFRELAKLIK